MFTRKQRLNNECTHREYYAQFVSGATIRRVETHIGREKIINSTDPHFNDIPLVLWDRLCSGLVPHDLGSKMRATGDYPTLSGLVCIAKEAARQIKES